MFEYEMEKEEGLFIRIISKGCLFLFIVLIGSFFLIAV